MCCVACKYPAEDRLAVHGVREGNLHPPRIVERDNSEPRAVVERVDEVPDEAALTLQVRVEREVGVLHEKHDVYILSTHYNVTRPRVREVEVCVFRCS